ncbi:hypothetical protein CEXT_637111 [Caerostris extrusa]|uniref:Uncharacterized protein n=1 Tax=Caerostris extrusa TaxID=172846 RepID=A0AAV4TEM8_CAEEX|nr:hypothetical protein CEXT_637111 [Caerostris extrusa]
MMSAGKRHDDLITRSFLMKCRSADSVPRSRDFIRSELLVSRLGGATGEDRVVGEHVEEVLGIRPGGI